MSPMGTVKQLWGEVRRFRRLDLAVAWLLTALALCTPAALRAASPQEIAAWRATARQAAADRKFDQAIQLLNKALEAYPSPEVIKELADVQSWAGHLDEAVKGYRRYLELKPADEAVRLALANTLSWSKERQKQREALTLYDAHLKRHPDDDKVRLQRARVRSWAGLTRPALEDFRAYLGKHPDDDKARLELAAVLSWDKDTQRMGQALALYDAYLKQHPDDHKVRLQRARVRSWAGKLLEAVADYRIFLAHEKDRKVRLELGKTLAWAGKLDEALLELKAASSGRGDPEARLARAQILRWSGHYLQAEQEIDALRRSVTDEKLRRQLDLELASIYGQTNRQIAAVNILDALLAREPGFTEARTERDRLGQAYRPQITPGFALYTDKGEISVLTLSMSGKVFIIPQLNLLLDAGVHRLSTAAETLWAEHVDLGAGARPWDWIEIEAAAGLRTYQEFTPNFGIRVDIHAHPLAGIRTSIQPKVSLHYAYDDIYRELFQPASVPAQIRGSALHGDLELQLPHGINFAGRLGGHFLAPENSSFEASGTATVRVYRMISAGYYGQWIAWDTNDPAYWSPQAYAAHMFILRAMQGFNGIGFYYDLQLSLGTAAERVEGIPEAGYGFAYGTGGGLVYLPVTWLKLRLLAQFGSTRREIVKEIPKVASTQTSEAEKVKISEASTYWWFNTSFSAAVSF